MAKLKEYLRTRKFSWWLSTALFGFIIVLIAFPSLRIQFSAWVNRQFLSDPEFEYKSDYPVLSDKAYQFSYYDLNDERHFFSEHKGKVVFVNLWGTWCGHCVAEMPSIEDLYKDYGDKVVFIMYSDRDSPRTLKKFKDRGDYTLPFVYKDPQVKFDFKGGAYPTTFIISKYGEIVHEEKGAMDWNADAVRKRLNELLKE